MEIPKPHVAILASPGMGHLIPLLELSKRFVTLHGILVTIFVPTTDASTPQLQLLQPQMLPDGLQIIYLPPVDISGLVGADAGVVTRICVIIRESLPAFRSAIAAMASPPTALVVDMFGTDAFNVADELKIPRYVYFTTTAACLALAVYVPTLDREVKGEYVDMQEPVCVPACKPIRVDDVVDQMLDRKSEEYKWYLHIVSRLPMAQGILVNTWEDLEPRSLGALREDPILSRIMTRPIYPVGPIVRSVGPPTTQSKTQCLAWLDSQPTESVVYVSFGSGGTLSSEQLTELAWGLELSQQPFVWVVRRPAGKDGAYFTSGDGHDDPLDYLPDGFATRIHGLGFVVPMLAPQVDILAHPSVGGFVSHCGWNSTLESIVHGVPLIAWPLYAEQKINATMLTEDLGMAVRPEFLPMERVVGRAEIERIVRLVMDHKEGKALRSRVKELRDGAFRALGDGGSSHKSLSEVAQQWKMIEVMRVNVQSNPTSDKSSTISSVGCPA